MERIGEYLSVKRCPEIETGKTCYWDLHSNSGDLLGFVRWNSSWRQYVFHPCVGTLFSAGCLRDIATFLEANRETRRGAAQPTQSTEE